jgi:hypothetical protein
MYVLVCCRGGTPLLQPTLSGATTVDLPDHSHIDCQQRIRLTLFDESNQLYVTEGFDEVLLESDILAFRELTTRVRDCLATEVDDMPEFRLYHAEKWSAVGFYARPYIYMNIAAFIMNRDAYGSFEAWFGIALHELAHTVASQHNGLFANVLLKLALRFVDFGSYLESSHSVEASPGGAGV